MNDGGKRSRIEIRDLLRLTGPARAEFGENMLSGLHSDLLSLVASRLDQLIDLLRLCETGKAMRDKLLAARKVRERIARGKERYGGPDICRSLENSCQDKQRHFIELFRWVCPQSELIGTIRSGDVEAVRGLLADDDFADERVLIAAGESRSMPMVEYVLEKVKGRNNYAFEERTVLLTGAAKRGTLEFFREVLASIGGKDAHGLRPTPSYLYHRATRAAVEGDNLAIAEWALAQLGDELLSEDARYLFAASRSTRMRKLLAGRCKSLPIELQLLAWLSAGNACELDRHRDDISAAIRRKHQDYTLTAVKYAMQSGSEETLAILVSLLPDNRLYLLSEAAIATGDLKLIDRHLSRATAHIAHYEDAVVLQHVLDKFDFRPTPDLIRRLLNRPNLSCSYLSCAYLLAKRHFPSFLAAMQKSNTPGIWRILEHFTRKLIR